MELVLGAMLLVGMAETIVNDKQTRRTNLQIELEILEEAERWEAAQQEQDKDNANFTYFMLGDPADPTNKRGLPNDVTNLVMQHCTTNENEIASAIGTIKHIRKKKEIRQKLKTWPLNKWLIPEAWHAPEPDSIVASVQQSIAEHKGQHKKSRTVKYSTGIKLFGVRIFLD